MYLSGHIQYILLRSVVHAFINGEKRQLQEHWSECEAHPEAHAQRKYKPHFSYAFNDINYSGHCLLRNTDCENTGKRRKLFIPRALFFFHFPLYKSLLFECHQPSLEEISLLLVDHFLFINILFSEEMAMISC